MAGRPEANIDWEQVDKLLEAGCFATEIAGYLGIHPDTLYNRCKTDKNSDFSSYSQQKRAKGESLLRARQYKEAMAGDKSMLIWLGKNRLKQADKQDMNVNANLSDLDGWVKGQEEQHE